MELDAEARDLLLLARDARTPSAEDKARIERRLALALGASAAAAVSASAAPAAASTSLAAKAGSAALLKWTLLSCAVITAGAAGYVLLSPAPVPQHAAAAVKARTAVPAAEPIPAPVPDSDSDSVSGSGSDSVSGSGSVSGSVPKASAEPTRAARHAAHPRTNSEAALRDELELLHAAQAAWRAGDAPRALTLTAEHERRHPHSALGLERDALRVLALCDAGKPQEAKRLARSWLARAPSSPLRASIEASCAAK